MIINNTFISNGNEIFNLCMLNMNIIYIAYINICKKTMLTFFMNNNYNY